MFNKESFFVGNHAEAAEWLNGRGYFVDENHMKSFLKKGNGDNVSQFGPYWLDEKKNTVCFGEALGYLPNNAPIYSDTILFELTIEGFTQKEINEAFYKAYKHLDGLRNRNKQKGIKDFLIEKKIAD